MVMKNGFLAVGVALILASCGSNNNAEESTTDSANVNMANQSPMGDTANQINSAEGSYPADTSNQNGDDSVKGTNPASRTTTPGNDSGQGGRKQ
jgi:hypothetical protein